MASRGSIENKVLQRVLTDPATGMPSALYFDLIRDWEGRRATEHGQALCVFEIVLKGFEERTLSALEQRMSFALRRTDLIASEGHGHYRVLLIAPNAERCDLVRERIVELAQSARGDRSEGEVVVEMSGDADVVTPSSRAHLSDRRRN